MKKLIITFILFIGAQFVIAQTVVSSCSASDNVKALYIDDADRLTVRKFYQKNLTYKDSIIIPQAHSDTILKALIAVHNAITLPARDTVVSLLNIHTFPYPKLNMLHVAANPTLSWMQQLNQGNIPTGNAQVDNLISTYSLTVHSYWVYSSYHVVTFKSNTNYNLQPLADLFENISGVDFSEPDGAFGDGNDIGALIYPDHVRLSYFLKWGDCPLGCTELRYWVFKVYYDCSVEYTGSYGNPLPAVPIPTISVLGSNCTNQTLTVSISGANYYSLNYQPLSSSQFTLSSPTPTSYVVMAGNYPFLISKSISIINCFTSVNENELYSTISIYPNPVNEILNVEFSTSLELTANLLEIKIIDVLGKVIMSEETKNGRAQINVSILPKGIYFIKAGNVVRKFMKE